MKLVGPTIDEGAESLWDHFRLKEESLVIFWDLVFFLIRISNKCLVSRVFQTQYNVVKFAYCLLTWDKFLDFLVTRVNLK